MTSRTRSLLGTLSALRRWTATQIDRRLVIFRLREFSDAELRDIGIDPSQISKDVRYVVSNKIKERAGLRQTESPRSPL